MRIKTVKVGDSFLLKVGNDYKKWGFNAEDKGYHLEEWVVSGISDMYDQHGIQITCEPMCMIHKHVWSVDIPFLNKWFEKSPKDAEKLNSILLARKI